MIATILKIIRFSDFSTYKRLIILQVCYHFLVNLLHKENIYE